MSSTTKYKGTDHSNWPVISKNEYASMVTQIAAGLLASGHYTEKVDFDNQDPAFESLLKERQYPGHYEPCVMEPAEDIVSSILTLCALNPPELEDAWGKGERGN